MPRIISFRLPFPPSVNSSLAAVRGRLIHSATARAYAIAAARTLPTGRVTPLEGRLAVTLSLSAPKRVKHWDIANREKILCDVLTKQRVWLDDSQIDFMMIMRAEPSSKGYVDVLIEELHEIRSNS